jgi:hypothetical protein
MASLAAEVSSVVPATTESSEKPASTTQHRQSLVDAHCSNKLQLVAPDNYKIYYKNFTDDAPPKTYITSIPGGRYKIQLSVLLLDGIAPYLTDKPKFSLTCESFLEAAIVRDRLLRNHSNPTLTPAQKIHTAPLMPVYSKFMRILVNPMLDWIHDFVQGWMTLQITKDNLKLKRMDENTNMEQFYTLVFNIHDCK